MSLDSHSSNPTACSDLGSPAGAPTSRRTCRCGGPVTGRRQVCEACEAKKALCEDCGNPHKGQAGTTRFCDVCRSKRRRKPTRGGEWTPEQDQLLRDAYREHHCTKAVAVLIKRLGRPKWQITKRAQMLGAATVRRKEPRWSEAEIEILRAFAWMVPERIRLKLKAAGFARTTTSVAVQRKRIGARKAVDGTSASGLAELLGIDPTTVLRWIDRGWLRAHRCGTTGDNHDPHFIPTAAVRTFLLRHYEVVDLGKAERAGSKLWLIELLTNGAIGAIEAGDEKVEEEDLDDADHLEAREDLLATTVEQVHALRVQRGISVKEMARRATVENAKLESYLSGRAGLPIHVLASLAIALDAEVEIKLQAVGGERTRR